MANQLRSYVLAFSMATLCLCTLSVFAQTATSTISRTSGSQVPAHTGDDELEIKRRESQIKADEYALKVADLDFRRRESQLAREAEGWKTLATFASVLVAILAVAAPVAIAVRSSYCAAPHCR